MIVASVLLALTGGAIAESGTAFAQPPNQCAPVCSAAPAPRGVSQRDWNAAHEAADFYANYRVNRWGATVNYRPSDRYTRLDYAPGRGWPGARGGGHWYGYWDQNTQNHEYVYYGGTFHDNMTRITNREISRHVSNTQAYPSGGGHSSPYVEYDMDFHHAPHSSRNARRIVRNVNNGHVYATFDHYFSFYYLGTY